MGKFSNIKKMIQRSMISWNSASDLGLTNIRTIGSKGNKMITENNHHFINMVSCSYLGLNRDPRIISGAIEALKQERTMSTSVSRVRIGPALLDDVEQRMSNIFNAQTILTVSCTAAAASILPIIASGFLTSGEKPLMIFDKNCHFCMNVMKAGCADETEVITCPHNDINYIEDLCKKHSQVAYIADGAYSMGGNAPIEELIVLQEKYGLFLYIDDSHSISVYGKNGVGLARSCFSELPDRTVITASLAKAFGATGGLILLSKNIEKRVIEFCGGPLGWSQMLNAPSLGAINASAKIHQSSEIHTLQDALQKNMDYIDSNIQTENAGNGLPIRVIDLPNVDKALKVSQLMYKKGFYCSAVFFPIVAENKAGLRIMGRADLDEVDITNFQHSLNSILAC